MAEEEEQAAANTIKIYQPTYQLEPKDTTVCVWGRGAGPETATGGGRRTGVADGRRRRARRFRPSEVRKLAEQVVEETLKDQKYDEENAREWSLEISETIKSRVKGPCERWPPRGALHPPAPNPSRARGPQR